MSKLKLGCAKIDITPDRPIPLCGFAFRHGDGNFKGIRDRLYARIMYFTRKAADGAIRSALIVSADLVWWGSERMASIRSRLRSEWGIEENEIILHGTHTHCGPQTSDRFVPSIGELDIGYLEQLESRLFEGIATAASNLEPVTVERATGECRIGVNRRSIINGEVKLMPNQEGPADPVVTVIRYGRLDGRIKAVMVHYTCHPTTTGDNWVSAEFPGLAMEQVEEALGSDTVAAYLQGFCGDVGPKENGDMYGMASILADEVLRILSNKMNHAEPLEWSALMEKIELPLQSLPTVQELVNKKNDPNIFGEWSRLLLARPEFMKPSLPLEATLITIAEGVSILSMNAEMVVAYGLYIKQHSGGKVLPVAYSNGMIGYVTTSMQLSEGGYEPIDSTYYFAMPAPFDRSVEASVTAFIDSIIDKSLKGAPV